MIQCASCEYANPDQARYCMQCGRGLPEFVEQSPAKEKAKGVSIFVYSVIASILLSLLLIFVFRMPILIFAAFLPLFWFKRDKNRKTQ